MQITDLTSTYTGRNAPKGGKGTPGGELIGNPFLIRYTLTTNYKPQFYTLVTFIIIMENTLTTLWNSHKTWSSSESKVLKYFQIIFQFCCPEDHSLQKIVSIIAVCFAISVYLWNLTCFTLYMKSQTFVVWTIHVMAICTSIFLISVYTPICAAVGSALYHILKHFSFFDLIIFLLGLVAIGLMLYIIGFFITHNYSSVFIQNKIYACWNPSVLYVIFYVSGGFAFLEQFSILFSDVLRYVLVVLHMLALIAIALLCLFKSPFLLIHSNLLIASLCFCYFLNDLLSFFTIKNLPVYFYLLMPPILSYILSYVLTIVYNKFVIKKLIEKEPKSFEQALINIHLACATNHPSFIEGSLIQTALDFSPNEHQSLELCRILVYIPNFQSIFVSTLSTITRSGYSIFSPAEKYLIYTLQFASTCRQTLYQPLEMNSIKVATEQLTRKLTSFWHDMSSPTPPQFIPVFGDIAQSFTSCEALWQDLIKKYPESAVVSHSYSMHLLENQCQYEQSATQLYRAQQIQNGEIFELSYFLVSFLQVFPHFANEILSKIKIGTLDDLDQRTREEILEPYLAQTKIRLESQKSLSNHTSPYIFKIVIVQIIRLIIFVGLWMVFISMYYNKCKEQVDSFRYIYNVSLVSISMGQVETIFWMEHVTKKYDARALEAQGSTATPFPSHSKLLEAISATDCPMIKELDNTLTAPTDRRKDSIDYSQDYMAYNAVNYIRTGRNTNQFIIYALVGLLGEDRDMEATINAMHNKSTSFYVYSKGAVGPGPGEGTFPTYYDSTKIDMRMGFTYYFINARRLANTIEPNFKYNQYFRETLGLFKDLMGSTTQFSKALHENNVEANDILKRQSYFIFGISAGASFVILLVLTIYVYVGLTRDINKLGKVCYNLPEATKKDGWMSLITEHNKSAEVNNDFTSVGSFISGKRHSKITIGCISEIICNTVLSILIVVWMILANNTFDEMTEMSSVVLKSGTRCSRVPQVLQTLFCINLLPTILLHDDVTKFHDTFVKLFPTMIDDLYEAHTAIQKQEYSNSAAGKKLMNLEGKEQCTVDSSDTTLHKKFECSSLDQNVVSFIEMAQNLRLDADYSGKDPDSSFITKTDFLQLIHLTSGHLLPQLQQYSDFLLEYVDYISNTYQAELIVIGVISIVTGIITVGISFVLLLNYKRYYSAGITLLLRLDPLKIANSQELMQYLLSDSSKKGKAKGVNSGIIMNSPHPILFMNQNQSVLGINTIFVTQFGLDPAHIVGHTIEHLIVEQESLDAITEFIQSDEDTLEKMRVACQLENGHFTSSEIDIYRLIHTEKDSSFAIIFTDCTTNDKLTEQRDIVIDQNERLSRALIPSFFDRNDEETENQNNNQNAPNAENNQNAPNADNNQNTPNAENNQNDPNNQNNEQNNNQQNDNQQNDNQQNDNQQNNNNNQQNDNQQNKQDIDNDGIIESENVVIFKKATVAMLKFNDISLNIAPADICSQFNEVWTKFDNLMCKYPKVEKLSIFNGVYTVIAGKDIFNNYAEDEDESDKEKSDLIELEDGELDEKEATIQAFKFIQDAMKLFQDFQLIGTIEGSIDFGDKLGVMIIGSDMQRIAITGDTYEKCWNLLQMSSSNKIALSDKGVKLLIPNEATEEKKTSAGKCFLYSPEILS